MAVPPELIERVSSMGIKELLALLISSKYGPEAVNHIREKVKELWNQRKYGFTPDAEESNALYEIGRSDVYRRFKDCLESHWSTDLIRVGIHISRLNDEGKREVVQKIKDSVYKKYGKRGTAIINMGSTGVITEIIDHLSGLRLRTDLNRRDLGIEFDKIIDTWERITFFVKADDSDDKIYSRITSLMDNRFQIFFVSAYGSAGINAMRVINKLNNEEKIPDNNYALSYGSRRDKAGLKLHLWTFELMED